MGYYVFMNHVFLEVIEELSPLEIVKYTKYAMLSLATAPQAWRDTLANALQTTCDEQCFAAIELDDTEEFSAYARAGRFIVKRIERYGYGPDFGRLKN